MTSRSMLNTGAVLPQKGERTIGSHAVYTVG